MYKDLDEQFMAQALKEAEKALALGEVPIGAVLVWEGEVVARGHNLKETLPDCTAHAEIIVLREACQRLNRWRLTEGTLYVTVEPCPMCAGALVQARVKRLVYGAPDPKAGAVDSLLDLVRDPRFNHRLEVKGGVLQEECQQIIQNFFRKLRENK